MVLFKISLLPSHLAPVSESGREWRERAVIKGVPDKILVCPGPLQETESPSQGYLWFCQSATRNVPHGRPCSELLRSVLLLRKPMWIIIRHRRAATVTARNQSRDLPWALSPPSYTNMACSIASFRCDTIEIVMSPSPQHSLHQCPVLFFTIALITTSRTMDFIFYLSVYPQVDGELHVYYICTVYLASRTGPSMWQEPINIY